MNYGIKIINSPTDPSDSGKWCWGVKDFETNVYIAANGRIRSKNGSEYYTDNLNSIYIYLQMANKNFPDTIYEVQEYKE